MPSFRVKARTRHAIDDAQQGLKSLLTPQTSDKYPHIISPSGATRSHRRGRVAGPATPSDADPEHQDRAFHAPRGAHLLEGADPQPGSALSLRPGSLPAPRDPSSRKLTDRMRLSTAVSQATGHVQSARERAMLLIGDEDNGLALGTPGAHASRRAAAQWVSRYATHLVILLVVGLLVAMSGLKTFTVQSAYPHGLAAVDSYTGTDHDEDASSTNGKPALDDQNFDLVLPRTTLSLPATQDAGNAQSATPQDQAQNDSQSAGQDAAQNAAPNADTPPTDGPAATDATRYTVARGDTVESIAAKFKLMPETLMGSNGIYDSEENLAPGRVLVVPPIDAMYYVAHKGDTLDSIAQAFQVDPSIISDYKGNGLGPDGAIKEGQPLLVPNGMMPERTTTIVYTVRRGDILKNIAARFGVDVPTMIDSNNIPHPDNLQPGSKLRVLPVPGMEYKVQKGDTIKAIANRLGVSPQMILDYAPNHLTVSSKLKIDQVIMVPGGSPPEESPVAVMAARVAPRDQPSARGVVRPPERPDARPQPPRQDTSAAAPVAPISPKPPQSLPRPPQPTPKPVPAATPRPVNPPKVGTGRLMWPVNGTITQYFTRSHNGLDIAISAGTPIHAADSGRIIWSGWRTDGLGYCVMIDHLNGLVTVYGHMIRQHKVFVGQYVSQGQVIGYIGSTGLSTGAHV
ncbi:MAG: LysM peptidoglycan-binding domain-containing protein, partial [Chloroflexia bacterium]